MRKKTGPNLAKARDISRHEAPGHQERNTLVALFSRKEYGQAEILAQQMTRSFPSHGFGWKCLGAAYKLQGRTLESLEPMIKAAELSPRDPESHSNLVIVFQELGRFAEAETSCRQLLKIKPDYAEAHNNLGIILRSIGKQAEAEACYRRALEIKPDFSSAYINLGNTLRDLGRLTEAEASYLRAIEINPHNLEAFYNLGIALNDLNRINEAKSCFRRALQINPNLAAAHSSLGSTLKNQGRLSEAVASFRQALAIKPDHCETLNNLGNTLNDLGRMEEAVTCYRRALEIKPDADVYGNLGNSLKALDRLEEALASYRLSLKSNEDWNEALRNLTTPSVLLTGLELGPRNLKGNSDICTDPIGDQIQKVRFSATDGSLNLEHDPAGATLTETAVRKLKVVLIYPPPWQIPSHGDILPGMPFGPPVDRNEHILNGDFQIITYGLLSIAAQAKRAGYDVSIYNLATSPWKEVVALLAATEADIYGISTFTANRRGLGAVAGLIRQLHPHAHITAGGPFVTALPLETMEHFQTIDTAVIGEGEDTFMELLECLSAGRTAAGIPGSLWREGKEIVIGPNRQRINDLDSLASPFDYFTSHIVMTSRGCPSRCTFCGSFTTWGRKLRFNSADTCLQLFKKALNRLPIPFLAIKDDTFTAHRQRAISICDAIIENKLNFIWSCDTRVDCLDDELLLKMRLAGCQMISLGVESGSNEILKAMRKETTPEMVLNVTRSARKYGMCVRYYMIILNRGESAESIQQSNALINSGRPERYVFCPLAFYPGTEDWELLCEKQGLTSEIFFNNDFKELSVATNRNKEFGDFFRHVVCDIGTINGFSYSIEERESVVDRLPDLHCVHLELANAYFRAGRYNDALSSLDRAEELGFPIDNIISNQRACIALAQNDIDYAINLLEHALQSFHHQIVNNNLVNLRAWCNSPVNDRGKPPVLKDSVQATDFKYLQKLSPHPSSM